MKWTYTYSEEQVRDYGLDRLRVGDSALLISKYNENTGVENHYLCFGEKAVEEGYPGNADSSVRRFHGWRGTSYGTAVYAHGVHRITSINQLPDSGLKIKIGKTDIKKMED